MLPSRAQVAAGFIVASEISASARGFGDGAARDRNLVSDGHELGIFKHMVEYVENLRL